MTHLVQIKTRISARRTPHLNGKVERSHRVDDQEFFAGQTVGVTQVGDHIWLVTFMQYDLGYFDDETCRLEPIDNPFGPKVLPMSSE